MDSGFFPHWLLMFLWLIWFSDVANQRGSVLNKNWWMLFWQKKKLQKVNVTVQVLVYVTGGVSVASGVLIVGIPVTQRCNFLLASQTLLTYFVTQSVARVYIGRKRGFLKKSLMECSTDYKMLHLENCCKEVDGAEKVKLCVCWGVWNKSWVGIHCLDT